MQPDGDKMKLLIIGGGIGGLVTALSLHQAGIDVELFEQSQELRELGVGINLLPHAVKELAGLGLLPALDAAGIRTRELIYMNRQGQVVWRELRGIDAGYEVPQLSIHRASCMGSCCAPSSSGWGDHASTPIAGWSTSMKGTASSRPYSKDACRPSVARRRAMG
jgi:hypothetical protein